VAMPAHRASAHAATTAHLNKRVAAAARERLSIDRPPTSFDTFCATYAVDNEADAAT
jgi:hypothetical protein